MADQVDSLIEKANKELDARRRQSHHYVPGHADELILSLVRLADLRSCQGDLSRAERLYREAVMHANDSSTTPLTIRVRLKTQLGDIVKNQGRLDEAREFYSEALRLADSSKVSMNEASNELVEKLSALESPKLTF